MGVARRPCSHLRYLSLLRRGPSGANGRERVEKSLKVASTFRWSLGNYVVQNRTARRFVSADPSHFDEILASSPARG